MGFRKSAIHTELLNAAGLQAFIREKLVRRETSFLLPDLELHQELLFQEVQGCSILVIGGAGSIGKAFIKAVLPFQPGKLIVIDWNENALAELTRDLRSTPNQYIPPTFITYPFDFGGAVFSKFLKKEGPFDLVIHFAAHKHVRSEKDVYAVEALLRNNVLASLNLLDQLSSVPPRHFFSVSTDKASDPVNIMGASKKLMEEAILTYSAMFKATSARFANVAFSNGSLPFSFIERLRRQQPLVAPLDIVRFFISPEEAGQICLLAAVAGNSSEIFFPKLEPDSQLSFVQMAMDILHWIGLTPYPCESEPEAKLLANSWEEGKPYPVYFSPNDTVGEKQQEIFFSKEEKTEIDRFNKLGIIRRDPSFSQMEWAEITSEMESLFSQKRLEKEGVVRFLSRLLPQFKHLETGKGLDEKM